MLENQFYEVYGKCPVRKHPPECFDGDSKGRVHDTLKYTILAAGPEIVKHLPNK